MGTLREVMFAMKGGGVCVVRHAVEADASRVLACARETFATSDHTLTKLDEFNMSEEQERAFLGEILGHPRQLFLVAEDAADRGGAMIGLLVLKQNTAKRKLRHSVELGMNVHSAYRGRGVGTGMLRAAVAWAEANVELEQMTLAVYASNEMGRALYRRCGFVEYGMVPGGLKHDDGARWDQVLMCREV